MRKKDNALTGAFTELRGVSECFELPPSKSLQWKFDPFSNRIGPKGRWTVFIFKSYYRRWKWSYGDVSEGEAGGGEGGG